ncbi:MAG: pyridoxamine 5'-phosphate oxidase family protein [Actinomycetota bacterium]|nr:pyridoxamine 5'-phosphate oxidase family protein [Actinomycetota bacterium]
MNEPSAQASVFHELTEPECQDLLRSKQVGRLGFTTPEGPQIIPVNYVYDDDAITFRTAAYNNIALHVPGQRVAFEVDEVDDFLRAGWSVLGVGKAEHAESPHESVEPWAPGVRVLHIRISSVKLTGRRVQS